MSHQPRIYNFLLVEEPNIIPNERRLGCVDDASDRN